MKKTFMSTQSPNLTRLPELQAGHLVQGQGHRGGEVQELKALTPGIKLLLLVSSWTGSSHLDGGDVGVLASLLIFLECSDSHNYTR